MESGQEETSRTAGAAPAAVRGRRDGPLRVAVGVITRGRPQMFANCLGSLERLEIPHEVTPLFIFVENDVVLHVGEMVADFRARSGHEALASIEPHLGIPFARNKVLELAHDAGCDALAFLDDDEMADPGWLAAHVAAFRAGDAVLMGGPMTVRPPAGRLSTLERWMLAGWQDLEARIDRRNRRHLARGKKRDLHIRCGNWFADLGFVGHHGLRFEEHFPFSAGEDGAFRMAVLRAGGTLGWVPDAKVSEIVSHARLRPGHVVRRFAFSTATRHRRLGKAGGPRALLKLPFALLGDGVQVLGQLVRFPFAPGPALFQALFHAGKAAGRVKALGKGEGDYYRNVIGS